MYGIQQTVGNKVSVGIVIDEGKDGELSIDRWT